VELIYKMNNNRIGGDGTCLRCGRRTPGGIYGYKCPCETEDLKDEFFEGLRIWFHRKKGYVTAQVLRRYKHLYACGNTKEVAFEKLKPKIKDFWKERYGREYNQNDK